MATYNELGNLPRLISLKVLPSSVRWHISENQQRGSLTALLKFSANEYDRIVKASPAIGQGSDSLPQPFFDEWVPKNLKLSTRRLPDLKRVELVGLPPRRPDWFTEGRLSPFVNGQLTTLGEGYLLLSLYSM